MPDDDLNDALARLGSDQDRDNERSGAARLTRRAALTGGGAGLAAALLSACGGHGSAAAHTKTSVTNAATGIFDADTAPSFTFVNHATTDSVFVATQNGATDACRLLGCKYSWTGSAGSNDSEMILAFNAAVAAKTNGIAVSILDAGALEAPIRNAIAAGIPVITYNSDAAGSGRLAYIGQDLFASGKLLGDHIAKALSPGESVGIFVATPGTANLQPRVNGVLAATHAANIKATVFASGALPSGEPAAVSATIKSHPHFAGFFAVDGSSTNALAQALQNEGLAGKRKAGGFDLTLGNVDALTDGFIDVLIDQQPYLQGFLPIVELYLHCVSDGLTGAADVDTGARLYDRHSIAPVATTTSRFEASGSDPGVSQSS